MTVLPIPFPEEYQNNAFFYLRQKQNGQYDLYIAVLVANAYEVTLNSSTPQVVNHTAHGPLLDVNMDLNKSTTNLGDRVETFVFYNIPPPSTTIIDRQRRIKIMDNQFIDYDDADENDDNYSGNIALDCPYVKIHGMIISAANTVRPQVIIPTRKGVQGSDNSTSSIVRHYALTLSTNNQTSFMQWKYADDIPEYYLGANVNDGYFEAYTTNPNTRKTKVKNKNKTSHGGGDGEPKSWWEKLKALWKRLVRKI